MQAPLVYRLGSYRIATAPEPSGLDDSRVTFTADSVSVNLQSLVVNLGESFTVNLLSGWTMRHSPRGNAAYDAASGAVSPPLSSVKVPPGKGG